MTANSNMPPDPLTLHPEDKIALIHQWRDNADRQRDLIRDYEADESVRDARAQAYLDWKAWLEASEATRSEHRLVLIMAICVVLGSMVWAYFLARVLL